MGLLSRIPGCVWPIVRLLGPLEGSVVEMMCFMSLYHHTMSLVNKCLLPFLKYSVQCHAKATGT